MLISIDHATKPRFSRYKEQIILYADDCKKYSTKKFNDPKAYDAKGNKLQVQSQVHCNIKKNSKKKK